MILPPLVFPDLAHRDTLSITIAVKQKTRVFVLGKPFSLVHFLLSKLGFSNWVSKKVLHSGKLGPYQ